MSTRLRDRLLGRTMLIAPADPAADELYEVFPAGVIVVASRGLAVPPQGAANGEFHLPGPGATGVWAGMAGRIALRHDNAWESYAPESGWVAVLPSEQVALCLLGGEWRALARGHAAGASFGYAAGVTLDVSRHADWTMADQMGGGMAMELTGVVPGVRGVLTLRQPGGLMLSGLSASGYYTRMHGAATGINDSAFLASGTHVRVQYHAHTVGGSGMLDLRVVGGMKAAVF